MGACAGKKENKQAVQPAPKLFKQGDELTDLQRLFEEESSFMNRKVKGYFEIALAGKAATTSEINMKFLNLGETGALHLTKVLPFYTNLKSLRLWKTKLGIEGAKLLSSALPAVSKLEVLSLEDNELKTEGTSYIAQALPSLPLLTELYLHVNKMGQEGVIALSKPLTILTNLQVLTLDENQIGKSGLLVLLSALSKGFTQLTLLGLAFNQLGDEGVRELMDCLPRMSKLKKLTLSGNNLSPGLEQELVRISPAVDFLF